MCLCAGPSTQDQVQVVLDAMCHTLTQNPCCLSNHHQDTLTERKIQSALQNLRSSRTTLIVAHRLSTIVDANIIAVLHLGQVVELGTHTELLGKQGLYADMWSKQLSGIADE